MCPTRLVVPDMNHNPGTSDRVADRIAGIAKAHWGPLKRYDPHPRSVPLTRFQSS